MTDTPPTVPTDPVALVTRLWTEIWIDGDLERIAELVADPYVRHTREGTTSSTPAEYARHISSAVRTIRGTEVEILASAVDGDTVFARLVLHGVNLETGNTMRLSWLTQYRLDDGRIAEAWTLHEAGLDW